MHTPRPADGFEAFIDQVHAMIERVGGDSPYGQRTVPDDICLCLTGIEAQSKLHPGIQPWIVLEEVILSLGEGPAFDRWT